MKTPFYSPYRITQAFGANPQYYKKFGLKAHEGLDLVPVSNNWTVLSLSNGVVVRDEDKPRSGAYGVFLTIWDKENKKAFQYCHLEKNVLGVGDIIRTGDVLGKMGSTGNSTGAHLHLNMFETDHNGIRKNRDNGYMGGVDPVPFLEQEKPTQDTQKIIDELRIERGTLQREKAELESELKNQKEKCKNISSQYEVVLLSRDADITRSTKESKAYKDQVEQQESIVTTIQDSLRAEQRAHGVTKTILAVCEAGGEKYTHLFGSFYYKT
jgi:hypothetical protein